VGAVAAGSLTAGSVTAGGTTAGGVMTLEAAASLAARKAAELINRNMGVPGSMTADEKKKLLWGKKAGAAARCCPLQGVYPLLQHPPPPSPAPLSTHTPPSEPLPAGPAPVQRVPGAVTGAQFAASGAATAPSPRGSQQGGKAGEGMPQQQGQSEGAPLVSPVAGGANHWERARFEDEATKSKFAKLMGVKAALPASAPGAGVVSGAAGGVGGAGGGGALGSGKGGGGGGGDQGCG